MNNKMDQERTRRNQFDARRELLRHASATLGSSSIKDVVKLPQGEDVNEWIAVNIVDFFNQITMLFGTISEFCTAESCPKMTAGASHEYFWSDDKGAVMGCPAPVYIDYLLTWVQDELDDENTFPSQIGKPFPPNFSHIAQSIMKRLFRIYAHIYHQHFELIEQLKTIEHLNTSFKHFILFVQEFNLIEPKQMEPLDDLIQKLTTK
ncbi:mob1/phocein family domain-containing protein [Ditylenchus destructor]|uniref:Mob1/phocein family domain-containing protein n=1 Tax=Ditylenchus destructor TaxID=166010 RepID=A0AAD4R742_9BILA|nr:mob1/phocein family domain-containing protein [Ditylenchus destructor]